jgi:toxin-antitoxin system PIN domain toxin
VIAVDTNLLVYAHRRDSPFHQAAAERLRGLAQGSRPWTIPWPCLHEFFSIATHPRLYDPPSTPAQAAAQIDAWLGSPSLVLIAEGGTHWATLRRLVMDGKVAGPLVHDARIAALCLAHGVTELCTLDRDFSRFPALKARNPLR